MIVADTKRAEERVREEILAVSARQTVCLLADDMVIAPKYRGNGLMTDHSVDLCKVVPCLGGLGLVGRDDTADLALERFDDKRIGHAH